jgi:hypothetical protein
LRLLIHVPLREKRDFRQMLVGFKHALCVIQIGSAPEVDVLLYQYSKLAALAEQLGFYATTYECWRSEPVPKVEDGKAMLLETRFLPSMLEEKTLLLITEPWVFRVH